MKKLIVGVALLCGCSSGNVSLVGVVGSSSQSLESAQTTSGPLLPEGLTVDRARLLLNEVELHGGGGGGKCSGGGRAVVGPYILTLASGDFAAATTKSIADVTVAAGTYSDLEFEIEPYDTSEGTEATASTATTEDLADFTAAGASAIIEGSYNGAPFKIVGKFEADQVTKMTIEVADGTPIDAAITLDPSTWFKDDSGNVIDPTNAANNDLIAQRICLSIEPGENSHCVGGKGSNPRGGGHGGRHGK